MAGDVAEPLGGAFDPAHRDEVAQTLLQAASDVLAAEGAEALTVRRIAAQAGVSTMNVYSRFGSKDGIIEQLFVEGFSRLRDAQDVGSTDDPLDDLRRVGVGYRRFARENPTYYSVMFERAFPNFRASEAALLHALGTFQMLADRVARSMDAGVMPRSDPLQTAATLWAALHGIVSLELKDVAPPAVDWEQVYETTMRALMIGLTAESRTNRGRPAG